MADFKELLSKQTAGLPNWAWGGILIVGVGAGLIFWRLQSKQAAATPAATPTTASTDTATQMADNNDNQLGSSPVYVVAQSPTDTTGATTAPPPPTTTTPVPTPTTSTTLMIRQKTPKDPASSKQTGVPMLAAPGGSHVIEIPFGASVTTTGLAVTGPNNNPRAGTDHGSTSWYPIKFNGQAGYISAYDIVGTGGGPDTRFPVGISSYFLN